MRGWGGRRRGRRGVRGDSGIHGINGTQGHFIVFTYSIHQIKSHKWLLNYNYLGYYETLNIIGVNFSYFMY